MSFSSELRQELCRRIDRAVHCRIAMLAGIIALDGKLKDMDGELCLSIRMEKDEVVETAEKLFQILFGIGLDSLEVVPRSQEGARVRIRDKAQLERVFETCKLSVVGEPDDTDASGSQNPAGRSRLPKLRPGMDARLDVDDIVLSRGCCRTVYLRGAFLAAGSVSDPNTQYQLEIVTDRDAVTRQILTALSGYGVEGHVTERRYSQVVYIKDADGISETLGQMGAAGAMMEFENVRIVKGIRNHVNREVNCDTANIAKIANAAVNQIEDIRRIDEAVGLGSLPAVLEELARLRLENPDLSLKELGERMDPPLGKSGVNHRLRKISEIAGQY